MTARRGWPRALLLGLALSGVASPVRAHQFAPALLELRELGADRVAVEWKQPLVRVLGSRLQPVLPVDCTGVGRPDVRREGTGLRASWQLDCPGGLAGRTVGVEGIASARADVLLRVALQDGRAHRRVLTPEEPSFEIVASPTGRSVLRGYGVLGAEHILTGWDHLLFVLGLVLLTGWGRSLLFTVTAFTLGHSLTLGLAALDLVRVPQAPVEALIALTIYGLAVEIVRARAGRATLLSRRPGVAAAGFGLLHGLGFAGALAEVGLPPGEIPLALLGFNSGIEIGQLGFLAALLLATFALVRLPVVWPGWARALPAYSVGTLGAYWFLERLVGLTPFAS